MKESSKRYPREMDITIQGNILAEFRRKLEEAEEFDDTTVSQLHTLLEAEKTPKANDIVAILFADSEAKRL